jgi:hypothetical protein
MSGLPRAFTVQLRRDTHHGGGPIAGTRIYEKFLRMTFREYGKTHENRRNLLG